MNIIPILPTGKIALTALVIGLVVGAAFCNWITTRRYDAEIAALKREQALSLKVISDQATANSEAALRREQGFQQRIAVLDSERTKERENAQHENDRLLADVASGRRRVQFANAALATCEQSAGAVRRTSGMGNATAVQLSVAAGQNILGVRAGINDDQAKLVYLQDFIRALQAQGVIANASN